MGEDLKGLGGAIFVLIGLAFFLSPMVTVYAFSTGWVEFELSALILLMILCYCEFLGGAH